MATTLNGRRVAILAADGVERVELEQPRQALEDAGARTALLSYLFGTVVIAPALDLVTNLGQWGRPDPPRT